MPPIDRTDSDQQLRLLADLPPDQPAHEHQFHPYGGSATPVRTGAMGIVYARGRYRVAEVLAVVRDRMLVELEIGPTGVNELRILRLDGRRIRGRARGYIPVRYDRIATVWLDSMVRSEVEWRGVRRSGRPSLMPHEVLAERLARRQALAAIVNA